MICIIFPRSKGGTGTRKHIHSPSLTKNKEKKESNENIVEITNDGIHPRGDELFIPGLVF